MAEVILRYIVDPASGKGSLVVDYRSEPDALPEEHETNHQAVVRDLLRDAGGVTVDRLYREVAVEPPAEQTPAEPDAEPGKLKA